MELYTNDGTVYGQLYCHEDNLEGECAFFKERLMRDVFTRMNYNWDGGHWLFSFDYDSLSNSL